MGDELNEKCLSKVSRTASLLLGMDSPFLER